MSHAIEKIDSYIPRLPFPDFKWKWATLTPTEGINDPIVLLGVLFRMNKLKGRYKYSSEEFAAEMQNLAHDLKGTGIHVDVSNRTGERNLIRNSSQYWKILGLIPYHDKSGIITLTSFGEKVADRTISQTGFSTHVIVNFTLPNPTMGAEVIDEWKKAGLCLHPLKLILKIICALAVRGTEQAYLTPKELCKIVIPLSGVNNQPIETYTKFIISNRKKSLDVLDRWPNCCPEQNDPRMAREFLLFLAYYGYLLKENHRRNADERYRLNLSIKKEILEIVENPIDILVRDDVISDTERKIVRSAQARRPNQAKFRKEVLKACPRCVITNVDMPEVLEAAHIKPYKYNGPDVAENGIAMRMDIHYLFDTGHLRISEEGDIEVSDKTRLSYGASIPPKIFIPSHVDRKQLRWRWDNYNGI